ncbi:d-alanyl-D-alanine carboxypeptidase [Clostridium sp. CAG:571]|nr:d-alanyl-D-alanine carboxypeptidase [Clostridium sp. CAG:571]
MYGVIYADDELEENLEEKELSEVINVASKSIAEPIINSRIGIIYDRKSGKVIWGKNENKRSAMASTTKIMTCIVVIENADLNAEVKVSAKAAGTGGSRLGLKKDDKITIKDLLYGLMLRSGNDAAVALAEYVGKDKEGFANLMNKKAKELGLKDTHFVTPHGLDDPEHYTTAYELAKIADYALKNEMFAKIVGTKEHTININGYAKQLCNTNELLGYLQGVSGVKTGFTNNAGRCLVTSVNRNDFEIITVVLGADTKKIRTADSINLIEYAYENYKYLNIEDIVNEKFGNWKEINKKRIQVEKGKNKTVVLKLREIKNKVIPVKKSDIDNINIEINCLYYLKAPIEKGDVIGNLKITLNEEVVEVVDIVNNEEIKKKDRKDYFLEFLKSTY